MCGCFLAAQSGTGSAGRICIFRYDSLDDNGDKDGYMEFRTHRGSLRAVIEHSSMIPVFVASDSILSE